jgi:NADH-quinone oxidoreductase subunit D
MAEASLRNFTLNFGPQHPAAHGVLRLVLELDGEVVERVDPHIGLLHRGTEKLIEHKTYLQALPYFDRLDYVAPMNQEHAFCLATARHHGTQARATYPRALLRDRALALASPQRDDTGVGRRRAHAAVMGLRGTREADGVLRTRVGRSHARELFSHRRCASGFAAEAPRRHLGVLRSLPQGLRRHRRVLTENRIFKQRNVSIAVVKLADAWGWGFSGVMVRGSGAAWDLRKAQPYECYSELDFDIPIGKNGDCYDRYCIRMEEMRQSVRIMKQCLEKLRLPEGRGPVAVRDNKIVPPLRAEMKRSMEATIHHFKLYSEGHHVPAGEVYAAVEAPKGEFGVYLVADGTNRPYRCKIRAPSFAHLQAMDFLSRGHMLADVSAILGSLDIVFGEIDR